MFKRFDRHYFDLLWAMTMKEFTVRYKQAVFGFLWVILNPLLQMIIMGIVFSNFVKIPNYFIFLFSGLLPWQFFSMTLSKVTPSFIYERSLLQKTAFPKEIVPLSLILSNILNLLLSIGLFIIVLVVLKESINFFLLLAGLMWLLLFTTGISLLTSSTNVRFRDVAFFVQSITTLWFYATPILYSFTQLPIKFHSFLSFNPLVAPIGLLQAGLLGQLLPSQEIMINNALIGLAIFMLGIFIFNRESPYFIDLL